MLGNGKTSFQVCSSCETALELTAEHFSHNRRSPSGFEWKCRPCRNGYAKEHPLTPEQRARKNARERARYHRNLDAGRARNRASYQRNKPRILARRKVFALDNPEHVAEQRHNDYLQRRRLRLAQHKVRYWQKVVAEERERLARLDAIKKALKPCLHMLNGNGNHEIAAD